MIGFNRYRASSKVLLPASFLPTRHVTFPMLNSPESQVDLNSLIRALLSFMLGPQLQVADSVSNAVGVVSNRRQCAPSCACNDGYRRLPWNSDHSHIHFAAAALATPQSFNDTSDRCVVAALAGELARRDGSVVIARQALNA